MGVSYDGFSSITICKTTEDGVVEKDSYLDFHLIPAKRLHVGFGKPNYAIYPLAGTSERRDITVYLPNGLTHGNRTGNWQFFIDHDEWDEWYNAYDALTEFINGAKVDVVLNEEPEIRYRGYLSLEKYSPGTTYSSITIGYDLDYETYLSDGYYPIRFINSDGEYFGNEFVFKRGAEYEIEFGEPSFGDYMKRLLVTNGA